MTPLANHPTTTQMAIDKHAKAAFEGAGLLLHALLAEDPHSENIHDGQDAYKSLKGIMTRRGLLKPTPSRRQGGHDEQK